MPAAAAHNETPPKHAPADRAARLAALMQGLDLHARLEAVRAEIPDRVVFTTSFGIEDQAIAHAILSQRLDIDIVTLDTGRLFPETYQVWRETEQRYARRIEALTPERSALDKMLAEHGLNGFYDSVDARHACCGVRKIEPLCRALTGASGWVTGLRAEQSADRSGTAAASFDAARDLIKVNPLFDWLRGDVVEFVRWNGVPYNMLHDRGFLSIGCEPCTRALKPGEPERAGRWWWEQEAQKECGLHSRPASAGSEVAHG